jgi:putative transcriptional regulator
VRFSTLEKICERLACQPGDIIRYVPGLPGSSDEDGADME